jgi:hypothetical protein
MNLTRQEQVTLGALRSARLIIRAERGFLIQGHCVCDKRGRPKLATMDEEIKPLLRRLDRALKKIEHALTWLEP